MPTFNITDLYNVCEKLKTTSGRKEKEQIIKDSMCHELFTHTMKFLFNNNITTGLDVKKINKNTRYTYGELESCDYWLEELFDYVTANNTGTDDTIAYVNFYMWKLTENDDEIEFLKELITKTLKLGVDVKTINKVYGYDLVPTFDVQLGTPIEKCSLPEGVWFSLSQKLNGTRCVYKKGKLYTRQGKEYKGLQHIIDDIEHLDMPGMVFDGELVLKDRSAGDSASFQIGTGIANSDAESKTELKMIIFDMIPVSEFEKGQSTDTYKLRKIYLQNLSNLITSIGYENIEVVRFFYEGTDQKEIWKWLDYTEEHDMEGAMLNLDAPYQCKRVKTLMKVKKFFDTDLKCIDMETGTGKLLGTLGAIVCQYGDNVVKVGSGFTDELRNYYWTHRDEIVGKIVTVKYKEETTNKQGQKSLQFPVFLGVREDKSEADA